MNNLTMAKLSNRSCKILSIDHNHKAKFTSTLTNKILIKFNTKKLKNILKSISY